MKNLKIKIVGILGLFLLLGSCEKAGLEQTEVVQNEVVKVVGLIDGGYVYPPSNEYSSKFNYFHNGVKLTDQKKIEEMLQNPILLYYDMLNIEIALNENEKQGIEAKNDLVDSTISDNSHKVAPKRGRIYYNFGDNIHGSGDRSSYIGNPSVVKFGNVANRNANITLGVNFPNTDVYRPIIIRININGQISSYRPNGGQFVRHSIVWL
jgi:hypothetical protein